MLLIVKASYWLYYYDLFFGSNSIVYSNSSSGPISFLKSFAYVLYNQGSSNSAYYFIVSILILSVVNLTVKNVYFITDFAIWFLIVNIHNRVYPALTGGNFLTNQFLFFNCFLSYHSIKQANWKSELKIVLHNLSVVSIIVQLCVVYFLAGLAKLNSGDWLSGTAINSVSQIKHFSLFSSSIQLASFPFFSALLSYVVLFYQLFFPILIWIKKTKKLFLIIGIVTHLYIACVMGLPEFGTVMIVSYIYIWPFRDEFS